MEQMYTVSWYDSNGELVECSFSNREVADYFYNYVSDSDLDVLKSLLEYKHSPNGDIGSVMEPVVIPYR